MKPLIIGLTGGIGTGKTVAAGIFESLGLPVHSADETVHRLLARAGAGVQPIAKLCPSAFTAAGIDRRLLASRVFGKPALLRKLETILHPLVQKDEQAFIKRATRQGAKAIILEIPLLFETKAERRCDIVICMSVARAIQKRRVMKRPFMTKAKFEAISKNQMAESEKRRRADYVIKSDNGRAAVRRQIIAILKVVLDIPMR